MSSDSEDDFYYTNSVSILRKITRKINTAQPIETNTSTLNDCIFENFETPSNTNNNNRNRGKADEKIMSNRKRRKTDTIESEEDDISDDIILDTEDSNDETTNSTDVDIIKTIDSVLSKPKTRKKTRRTTHARKRKSNQKSVVDLDSEDEQPTPIVLDNPSNDDNYVITVKVCWKSHAMHRFEMRRKDKLGVVFKFFAEKENLPKERLLFTLDDKIISHLDSPFSLDIGAGSIIEGGVISEEAQLKPREKDLLQLRVVCQNRRRPLFIKIAKQEELSAFMSQCAEQLKVPVTQLKFRFDGDLLDPSDNFLDLGIENGDCIDCWGS